MPHHYGNFLGFLDRCGWLRHDEPTAASVTAENVDAYLAELKTRVSLNDRSMARYAGYGELPIYGPGTRLRLALGDRQDLALVTQPRVQIRSPGSDGSSAGSRSYPHSTRPKTLHKMTKLACANQVRNGLMVALLALCPIRRKNFVALEIGRSLVKIQDTWWIVLSADETKERRADERPINELLTPLIDRYISDHRPVLAQSHRASSFLWLSSRKGTPISDKGMARVIRQSTLSTVGVAIGPHLFRTSGGIVRRGPRSRKSQSRQRAFAPCGPKRHQHAL